MGTAAAGLMTLARDWVVLATGAVVGASLWAYWSRRAVEQPESSITDTVDAVVLWRSKKRRFLIFKVAKLSSRDQLASTCECVTLLISVAGTNGTAASALEDEASKTEVQHLFRQAKTGDVIRLTQTGIDSDGATWLVRTSDVSVVVPQHWKHLQVQQALGQAPQITKAKANGRSTQKQSLGQATSNTKATAAPKKVNASCKPAAGLAEYADLQAAGFDIPDDTTLKDPKNRLLRKIETVIQRRTSQVILVLERSTSSHNYSACLRTAEALGIQHVWCVAPPSFEHDEQKRAMVHGKKSWDADAAELREHVAFAKYSAQWLTFRSFSTTTSLINALRADDRQIWVTDLSQHAVTLEADELSPLPPKVAICFGTEFSGASIELLSAADHRVYLPLHGFADSLNVSVAAALILKRVIDKNPSVVGSMSAEERAELRTRMFPEMGRTDEMSAFFSECAIKCNAGEMVVEPFCDLRRNDEARLHQGVSVLAPEPKLTS